MFRNNRSLIRLSLVVIALFMIVQVPGNALAQRETIMLDGEITKTYSLKEGGSFSVSNVNGRVEVESWNKAEVEIVITERRRGNDEIEVDFDVSDDRIYVSLHHNRDRWRNGRSSTANIRVKVPKKVKLSAESVNGDVTIVNIEGAVDAQTTNGDLNISTVTGDVEANTTNGRVELEGITGEVSSTTTNASINVLNSNSPRMDIHTTNGRIRAEFEFDSDGDYRFRTTNGDIEVSIPKDSKADVDIVCRNRRFDTDFEELKEFERDIRRRNRDDTGSRRRSNTYDRDLHVRETINGGGAALRIRTTNGDVSLRHK
ncbi:MAG: DUF4097 domain-containing protein [bacterium]|nr:DUF4097 domain-containing protein [bacterium]